VGDGAGHDVSGTEGESGDVLGCGVEDVEDNIGADGEHLGVVDLAAVEEALDVHLVLEGTDLEFVEEGSLTSRDLLILTDNLNFVDNLDLGFDNLGLDVKGLEERGLLRVKTGRSSGDSHIAGSKGADTGGGLTNLGVKDGLDFGKVAVGEDESSVENQLGRNAGVLLLGFLSVKVSDGLLDEGLIGFD